MRLVCLLLALAACESDGHGADWPIEPGGGGGGTFDNGSGTLPDAPSGDAPDTGSTIEGRVCLLADLRNWAACADIDYSSFSVALEAETVSPSPFGLFEIATPVGSDLTWLVDSEAPPVASATRFSAEHVVFAVATSTYDDLGFANLVDTTNPGAGALFVRVRFEGEPLAAATATITPPLFDEPILYDGADPNLWEQDATSANGVIWFPDVAAGTPLITVTPPVGSGAAPLMVTLPVAAQRVTFATVVIL